MRGFIRRHLSVIAVAAVVAVATASAPVIATTVTDFARNADRVDNKHAVGARASAEDRARKLVATSRAGRLPNDIIAKAPDAGRLDGLDSSAFVRTGDASRVAAVAAVGDSVFQPPTVVPVDRFAQFNGTLAAPFTTERSGVLHLTLHASVRAICNNGSTLEWVWLSLDGMPIEASLQRLPEDVSLHVTLTAVTDQEVAAGTHTMRLSAGCAPEAAMSSTTTDYVTGSVLVIS